MQKSRAVMGFWLAHCMGRPEMMDAAMNDLLPMVAEGVLKPVGGGRYSATPGWHRSAGGLA